MVTDSTPSLKRAMATGVARRPAVEMQGRLSSARFPRGAIPVAGVLQRLRAGAAPAQSASSLRKARKSDDPRGRVLRDTRARHRLCSSGREERVLATAASAGLPGDPG